ncbi:hypothetical protein ISN76_12925 [Dyella halodurans]|uniref:Uncharacterized protein n=1 Tax=Dyella halodurans TaxID=1920171 RepID=A0ABV9C0B2_9GAMM|nr:hypothetical protein [Dyella halodurans]
MADVIDVMNALVATMAQVIYPNGTAQPPSTGLQTVIYPGWPQSSQLDADLAGFSNGKGGRIHVTVYASGNEKNTTRYSNDWQTLSVPNPTLTASIAGQTVTIGGTVSTPQNMALLVNGAGYTYAVQPADTLTSIATALAALVPGASNTGPVITFPATARIQAARVGGVGTAFREVRRQQRLFQVTIWADTQADRETTAQAIDVPLAATEFLTMSDGTAARIIYQSSRLDDMTQKANLYRRDLTYLVEYATTQTAQATQVVMTQENIHTGVSGSSATTTTQTTYQ